jgi:hypothetical protein
MNFSEKILIAIATGSIVIFSSIFFSNNTIQIVDFEDTYLQPTLKIEDINTNYTYQAAVKGFHQERSIGITSAEKFSGHRSIFYGFSKTWGLGPRKNSLMDRKGNGTDKVHHSIIPVELKKKVSINFGKTYFFGFAFKIDEQSEVPEKDKEVIIFQLWQGSPFSPPLKVYIINKNAQFALQVSTKNDITGSNPSSPLIHINQEVSIEKNTWYRLVMKVVMRHNNMDKPGMVNLWLAQERNPLEKISFWKGYLGYDPKRKGNYAGKTDVPNPNSSFQATIGVYRERQKKLIKIYFDNVKVAKYLSAAEPLKP